MKKYIHLVILLAVSILAVSCKNEVKRHVPRSDSVSDNRGRFDDPYDVSEDLADSESERLAERIEDLSLYAEHGAKSSGVTPEVVDITLIDGNADIEFEDEDTVVEPAPDNGVDGDIDPGEDGVSGPGGRPGLDIPRIDPGDESCDLDGKNKKGADCNDFDNIDKGFHKKKPRKKPGKGNNGGKSPVVKEKPVSIPNQIGFYKYLDLGQTDYMPIIEKLAEKDSLSQTLESEELIKSVRDIDVKIKRKPRALKNGYKYSVSAGVTVENRDGSLTRYYGKAKLRKFKNTGEEPSSYERNLPLTVIPFTQKGVDGNRLGELVVACVDESCNLRVVKLRMKECSVATDTQKSCVVYAIHSSAQVVYDSKTEKEVTQLASFAVAKGLSAVRIGVNSVTSNVLKQFPTIQEYRYKYDGSFTHKSLSRHTDSLLIVVNSILAPKVEETNTEQPKKKKRENNRDRK